MVVEEEDGGGEEGLKELQRERKIKNGFRL